MSTLKRRVNVALPQDVDTILKKISKRDSKSQSAKALELIEIALRLEEDELLDQLAQSREKNTTHFQSHDDTWA
jgi:hypothetical protein